MTLLAKNAAGWARLRRIMSATQLPDRVPTTSRDTLNTLAGEDLVMLLEPASEPRARLAKGRPDGSVAINLRALDNAALTGQQPDVQVIPLPRLQAPPS
ncbi:hypothetical protein [Streptomyces gardneri]|uniref:hypothetical protein n=1 Tax=Streptomyces gardneri TaxID=66892 RepID=UPI0034004A26